MRATIVNRGRAIIGIVVVAGLVATLWGVYQRAFTPVVMVHVRTDRAGLLLDKGSAVRAFGVRIGEVRSTHVVDGNAADVDIALDKGAAAHIPAGVKASIRATTVFGAKFVDLEPTAGAVTRPITSNSTIRADGTTIEVNDVFQHALGLIDTIRPAELDTTLTSVAGALNGRGAELGRLMTGANNYLGALQPHLDTLSTDVTRAASVAGTYADVAPQLIATADQASTTSQTLSSKQAVLDHFLTGLDGASSSLGDDLQQIEGPLAGSLRQLTPVTGLLNRYGPELGCVIAGLATHNKRLSAVVGNKTPGAQTHSTFLPAQAPYKYPQNLPKLVSGVGPRCYDVPADQEGQTFTHIDFNDGTYGVYDNTNKISLSNPLSVYPDAAQNLLGNSGLAALVRGIADRSTAGGAGR